MHKMADMVLNQNKLSVYFGGSCQFPRVTIQFEHPKNVHKINVLNKATVIENCFDYMPVKHRL